jgi:hypothetical protein
MQMLRKILLVLVLIGLIAIAGCKKSGPGTPGGPNQTSTDTRKKANDASKEAAKENDSAKSKANRQLEKATEGFDK